MRTQQKKGISHKNKIYIYDQMSHFTVIEFDNTKKWNYRKQIK